MSEAQQIVHVGPTVPHHTYLGGSDIGAVFGLSPHKSSLAVWMAKTQRGQAFDNKRTKSGNRFERVILENYIEDTGHALTYPGTLSHTKQPTGSTPDAIENGKVDVQVKFVGVDESRRWLPEILGGDGIPPEVYAQVHWETWHIREVLGVHHPVARVLAQIGTEPRVYDVVIDDDFTSDLIEGGLRWWHDYVVADKTPIVTQKDADNMRWLYRRAGKQLAPITDEVEALAREYKAHGKVESDAKKLREAVAVKLMDSIRDGLGFEGNGVRATWREQRGNIDWQKVARELGATDEWGEACRKESHRVLDVRVREEK